MKRLFTISLAIGLLGCGQREQQSAVVQVSQVSGSPTGQPADPGKHGAAQAPKTEEPARGFEYPTDLTGKAIVKAVAPETPALTPSERFGAAPKPRTVPAKIANPESVVKANYMPPPILPKNSSIVAISPPREQVPVDLGRGADTIPAKPTLPIAAAITDRARDVNLPPAMSILGRPLNERVSLDDPTSEFANAAIVAPGVKVPLASADFVKVALPDPFELADQVKPKVPAAAEPGLKPDVVNPQRVK
jgi:hypothetical protein